MYLVSSGILLYSEETAIRERENPWRGHLGIFLPRLRACHFPCCQESPRQRSNCVSPVWKKSQSAISGHAGSLTLESHGGLSENHAYPGNRSSTEYGGPAIGARGLWSWEGP